MSESHHESLIEQDESMYREYILDVKILEALPAKDSDPVYHFQAPQHKPVTFEDPEIATLYADVYFDTNGFQEEGTGERGVPHEVIQAGRDTLAAYYLTMRGTDINWVASFYGKKPTKIQRYIASVRDRAQEIRSNASKHGIE